MDELILLGGYGAETLAKVRALVDADRLGATLLARYGDPAANPHAEPHAVRSDPALYDYAQGLKQRFMRSAPPLGKVLFDHRPQLLINALGTHTTISRVQGNKLKAKRELRVAGLFRELPIGFLKMIVVHELAHIKEREHDKAFYALCEHMEPDYHQLEFDLRLVLTQQALSGAPLWPPGG